jgi:DNA polymerase-3 subunit alpha
MDEWVTVAGVITGLEIKKTRKGDWMAIVILEDKTGEVEIVFFPGSYVKVKDGLAEDLVCFISGKKDDRNFIGNRLEVPKLKGL